MKKLPVEVVKDLRPLCPYCEQEMAKLLARQLPMSVVSRRMVYCCPHCNKVIGVAGG
jgi:uncharacterized protein with PIN domain